MPKLVIVESPAKAKTIGKYLGRGYKVTASMGWQPTRTARARPSAGIWRIFWGWTPLRPTA